MREVLGYSLVVEQPNLGVMAKIPSLPVEVEEYGQIQSAFSTMLDECKDSAYRRKFLLAGDWGAGDKLSCWLSFQYLCSPDDEECLVASMRSCHVNIMASDLGFASRLALMAAKNPERMKLLFIAGSLHAA